MKRFIGVHTGEIMAGQGEVILKSDTSSACIVIVGYDISKKIGGLAHAMFLKKGPEQRGNFSEMRDVEKAIDEMVKDMTLLGAKKENIEIRLVTGENVPHEEEDPDYDRNINSTLELLKQKHLRFNTDSIGDAGEFHVAFDVESGSIAYM